MEPVLPELHFSNQPTTKWHRETW